MRAFGNQVVNNSSSAVDNERLDGIDELQHVEPEFQIHFSSPEPEDWRQQVRNGVGQDDLQQWDVSFVEQRRAPQ